MRYNKTKPEANSHISSSNTSLYSSNKVSDVSLVSRTILNFMRYVLRVSVFLATFALMSVVSAFAQPQTGPYLDANGWTVFSASADTRTIYVSSRTGSDANDGLSAITPVKTIVKGLSLLRSGYPDWLLLNKGDSWTNEAFSFLCVSGRSASEPILISSYGAGTRPLIRTVDGVVGIGSINGGCSAGKGDFIALVGLEFYAYTRDPTSPNFAGSGTGAYGTRFLNPITWILIEDCKFSFYFTDVDFDASSTTTSSIVSIRRNVIADSYADASVSHAQGMYLAGINHLLVEENVFDHNGWNESVSGAYRTIYNRNVYIQYTNGPATFRGNISARSSAEGAQARTGGVVTNNLFVRNAIGFDIGHQLRDGAPTITNAIASGNVIQESDDIDSSNPRGYGIQVLNATGNGIQVTNNIIAHEASAFPYGVGIYLDPNTTAVSAINNIIYRWDSPIIDNGVGNVTWPNAINTGYPDPNRTVETYNVLHGGSSSLSDFMAQARLQSKDYWRLQYMANAVNEYIRTGFGITASPTEALVHSKPDVPLTTPSVTSVTSPTPATSGTSRTSPRSGTSTVPATSGTFGTKRSAPPASTSVTSPTPATSGTSTRHGTSTVAGTSGAFGTKTSTPPAVAITSPVNGTAFRSNDAVSIAASASSPSGISSITIMGDRAALQTCTNTTSCSATWQGTNSLTQGTHTISAIAIDTAGYQASASVTIIDLK